jgi:hypothetical protein
MFFTAEEHVFRNAQNWTLLVFLYPGPNWKRSRVAPFAKKIRSLVHRVASRKLLRTLALEVRVYKIHVPVLHPNYFSKSAKRLKKWMHFWLIVIILTKFVEWRMVTLQCWMSQAFPTMLRNVPHDCVFYKHRRFSSMEPVFTTVSLIIQML